RRSALRPRRSPRQTARQGNRQKRPSLDRLHFLPARLAALQFLRPRHELVSAFVVAARNRPASPDQRQRRIRSLHASLVRLPQLLSGPHRWRQRLADRHAGRGGARRFGPASAAGRVRPRRASPDLLALPAWYSLCDATERATESLHEVAEGIV